MNELIDSFCEISFEKEQDFLKIKETLTRIGVASRKEKKIWQSVHILHKRGKYYLMHFKELFALDGKPTDFTEEDKARRDTIASLLQSWGLLKILNPSVLGEKRVSLSQIKILSYKEKGEWELCQKYNVGKVKLAS